MNRKGQVFAIREIFQFGLGVVLLTAIIYMFYNQIIPQVATYALELEARNINSHVNYLIMNMVQNFESGVIQGDLTLEFNLPNKFGEYSYTTFFTQNQLCTLVNKLNINLCMDLNLPGSVYAKGVYFSGGELNLILSKNPVNSTLIMSN